MKIFKLTVYYGISIGFITLYLALNVFAGWSEIVTGKNIDPANGVWGSSESDIFVVGGSDSILHFDGNEWSEMETNSNGFSFSGVWGSSNGDVYVVGLTGSIVHYNGNVWDTIPINEKENLKDVWGSSNNNVFVVGNGGVIYHYDGNAWLKMTTNVTGDIHGVWGSSENDVYAVGNAFIIHYDGNEWTEVFDTPYRLIAIWGNSKTNIYAVAMTGPIFHYDGNEWSQVGKANGVMHGVWGTDDGVWFVGHDKTGDYTNAYLLYFNGTWSELVVSTFSDIDAIWGSSGSNVYAVGGEPLDGGSTLVIHFDGVFDDDYTKINNDGETDIAGEQAIDDSEEDPNRAPADCFISTINYK
jgi:hypothetical protein